MGGCMRRSVVGAMIVGGLAAAASAPLAAQMAVSSPVRFGITGGLTAPVGSSSDHTGTGWNAGALVNVGFPLLPLGFRVDAAWQQLPGTPLVTTNTKLRVIDGTLNATYSFGGLSPVNFYFIGGLGVYNVRREVTNVFAPPAGATYTTTTTASQTRFGLNGGIGFLFRLSGFSTFVEARYHDVFTSGGSTEIVPVSVGIVF